MPTGCERAPLAACLLAGLLLAPAARADTPPDASPIYGVTIPEGYRQWQLIAPALEAEPLDELRAVLGNGTAVAAYRAGILPFPDGTVLVKLAWQRRQSSDRIDGAGGAGQDTNVDPVVAARAVEHAQHLRHALRLDGAPQFALLDCIQLASVGDEDRQRS